MSEEPLEAIAARLTTLEVERAELVAWLRGLGFEPTDRVNFPPDSEEQPRILRLRSVTQEIEMERQRYIARLLASLNAISARQAEAATRTERASLRLEGFTVSLLFLTGVLATVGAGSYILQSEAALNVTGAPAFFYATVGTLVVLAFFFVILWGARKRYGLGRQSDAS